MVKQIVLKIYGRVQGVFFRAEAQNKAETLGLVGYAKNLDDGAVEIVAEGEEEKLHGLLAWAKRGPELAEVAKIDAQWLVPSGNFNGFEVE